jgi:hypothetical protein
MHQFFSLAEEMRTGGGGAAEVAAAVINEIILSIHD